MHSMLSCYWPIAVEKRAKNYYIPYKYIHTDLTAACCLWCSVIYVMLLAETGTLLADLCREESKELLYTIQIFSYRSDSCVLVIYGVVLSMLCC